MNDHEFRVIHRVTVRRQQLLMLLVQGEQSLGQLGMDIELDGGHFGLVQLVFSVVVVVGLSC